MEEKEFFEQLLDKTQIAFFKSETFKKNGDKNWNYAICDTPIQEGKGIFFGLNWGGKDIDVQTAYPEADKKRNWNFISKSRPYFRDYIQAEIEGLNYSNLCFFRSPKFKDLHPSDWSLVIPLFQEYVDYINPPWALMLGKPSPLWANHLTNKIEYHVFDKKYKKKVYGYNAFIFQKYPFGAVPHPQARVSNEARKEIWEKVIDAMMELKK
jgi:hypothetical protein